MNASPTKQTAEWSRQQSLNPLTRSWIKTQSRRIEHRHTRARRGQEGKKRRRLSPRLCHPEILTTPEKCDPRAPRSPRPLSSNHYQSTWRRLAAPHHLLTRRARASQLPPPSLLVAKRSWRQFHPTPSREYPR